jgi:hypothetical protein
VLNKRTVSRKLKANWENFEAAVALKLSFYCLLRLLPITSVVLALVLPAPVQAVARAAVPALANRIL